MIRYYFMISLLLSTVDHLYASGGRQIVYQNEPLQVQLQVGRERHFALMSAVSVKVGIPKSLRGKLSVTTIGSQVWLLAQQSFDKEKVIFKTPNDQMVLELSAAKEYPPGEAIFLSAETDVALSNMQTANPHCDIGMVRLVRYALQWAYAPRRLLNETPCISAISYPKKLIDIMNCLRINEPLCGGGVVAQPIAAWRTDKLYASLLELKNTLHASITLDPRAISGDFKGAALAHHKLEAAGSAKAVTVLVVVSDKPLSQSISKERWLDKELTIDSPTVK